jgi:hypothetical protein
MQLQSLHAAFQNLLFIIIFIQDTHITIVCFSVGSCRYYNYKLFIFFSWFDELVSLKNILCF